MASLLTACGDDVYYGRNLPVDSPSVQQMMQEYTKTYACTIGSPEKTIDVYIDSNRKKGLLIFDSISAIPVRYSIEGSDHVWYWYPRKSSDYGQFRIDITDKGHYHHLIKSKCSGDFVTVNVRGEMKPDWTSSCNPV